MAQTPSRWILLLVMLVLSSFTGCAMFEYEDDLGDEYESLRSYERELPVPQEKSHPTAHS